MKQLISMLVAMVAPAMLTLTALAGVKDAPMAEDKVEKKAPTLTFYYFDG